MVATTLSIDPQKLDGIYSMAQNLFATCKGANCEFSYLKSIIDAIQEYKKTNQCTVQINLANIRKQEKFNPLELSKIASLARELTLACKDLPLETYNHSVVNILNQAIQLLIFGRIMPRS
jgi:hypothetical protein